MLVKEVVWLLLLLCIEEKLMGSEDVSIYNSTALKEALSSTKKVSIPKFLCPRPTDAGMKNLKLYSSDESNPSRNSIFNNFDDEVIQKTTFSGKKLAVIAHGFTENGNATWMSDMANALVGLGNMNVITVNWGDLSTIPYTGPFGYPCVLQENVPKAAQRVANLLERIVLEKHQKAGLIHLIGFSLGAHMMGATGRMMKDAEKEVGRITGLDPAGPLISGIEKKNRLDPSHAIFVDAIHTDTRLITLEENLLTGYRWEFFFLGTNKRMAKSDFYPNDGYEQPGCAKITISLGKRGSLSLEPKTDIYACSHRRSYLLFTESIENQNGFNTYRCENNLIFAENKTKIGDEKCRERANKMGYFTNLSEEGVFYLKTNNAPPFATEKRRRNKKTNKTRRA